MMVERLLPKLDTGVVCHEPASELLISAVSETLNTPRDNIQLFDSFIDLGGDQTSADALHEICKTKGIEVKLDDIMNCQTLAELQTRVTPWPLRGTPVTAQSAESSPVKSEGDGDQSVPSSTTDDVFSPANDHRLSRYSAQTAYSGSSYGSVPSDFSLTQDHPIARSAGQDLESLLKSSPRVSNVCLVTPRAGFFDGQLVALVKVSSSNSQSTEQNSPDEIALPPQSQHSTQKQEIRSLRMAVQEWGADSRRPQIWIPLLAMAELEGGRPDTRTLQTWVQNLSEANYEDIMKLQIPEPRNGSHDFMSRRQQVQSWAESRRSAWADEDDMDDDLDDMECYPLAPMQQLFFTTSMGHSRELAIPQTIAGPGLRYSQSITLRILGGAEDSDIEAAVEAMVARHGMLRARFRPVHKHWVQIILPDAPDSYTLSHHTNVDDEEKASLIDQAQATINPITGPVFDVKHIKNGNEHLLYLVAHQLVVDAISWRIMVHDLDELLREGTLLSEGSIPFPHWVDYQNYEMSQRLFEPTLPFTVTPADLSYWGLEKDPNCFASATKRNFSIPGELLSVLQKACPEVLRTEATDVFLASLLLSFVQTFSDRPLPTLWKQEHGRDVMHNDFNIMETVGWFNSLCPIGANVEPSTGLIQAIKQIKDTRRAIPRDGIPFFTSEVSNANGTSSGIPVEISFNWVDNQGVSHENGILQPVPVPDQRGHVLGSDVGPFVGRIALFEVSVVIDDWGAQVDFSFNKNSKWQRKIEKWVHGFESLLLEAVSKMRFYEPELTLSDVPLLRTTYKALTKLGSDRLSGAGLPQVKDIETIYPITPTQQEILMAQSQNMYSFHVHNVYELRNLDGKPVDATRLCKAWESIVANKPALRSIFIDGVSRDGLFDRVVLKKITPNMLFLESSDPAKALSNLPPLKTPVTEPRHRLTMCQTPSTTMVRVDTSQAICDLTSVHHLISELCKVYAGEEPIHNEALHRTYLYHISSLDTSFSLEVWKAGLASVRPCFFPRLAPEVEEVMPHPFDLDVTRDQLMGFCKASGARPAAVLQLAWALVLRIFIGVDKVVFGYQYAGRDDELLHGIGQAVGSFANVLPCVIELAPGQAIKDTLERVNEAFAVSTKHQSLTMAEIQHAMRFEEPELFNTCLLFQDSGIFAENDDAAASQGASLEFKIVTSSRRTHCDVSLTASFINNRLHANLSSRFLSDLQTKSIVHSFEAAVKNIIEHSASLISEVGLFTDRDYASLVVRDWELAQKSQKVSACLHDVILRHGQTQPNAPAIHSWDGDMSYIQFATLVAKLRTYLVNLGVGPGKVIPVVLEKNRWAPVMLLAVLQAGASFVALDCQDQVTAKSTIAYLVPPIVLAAEAAWRELGGVVLNLVIINDAFFAMLPPRMSYVSPEAAPEHAACAFVTPKRTSSGASRSIFFTHESLCSVFAAQGPALKMDNQSRVLQLSAFNVDISLVEILGTLFHGGCICIPSAADRLTNLQLVMDQMHVTWTYMTSVLARKINPLQVPMLKTIVFRTRKLDQDTYGPWLDGRNVLLAYGAPDVCPLGISITEINRERALNIIPPPISGRFWILNPEDPRKLMPLGSIGELAIDSPLVTPNRFDPELPLVTQRPSSSDSSDKQKSRYLKTGHRVRYLDDGSIEFISSANDDIIVNGQTVDVAEVEQRIRRCLGPGIDVTVDKIRTKDSVRTLAAFLELGDSLFHGKEGLDNVSQRVKERAFIAKKLFEASLESHDSGIPKLPDHCIPAVYIPLKSFPISTSLKINRRKLLRTAAGFRFSELVEMSMVHNPHEIQRVVLNQKPLPLTRPEEVMRAIWARVLGISPLDIKGTSSFFTVGGNKFLASELVVACRKVGIRVSLVDIFNGATLTEISRSAASPVLAKKDLEKHSHGDRKKSFDYRFVKEVIAPKLDCGVTDVVDVAEASSEQIRNLELAMYRPRGDISCLAVKFNGRVSPEKLESACEALVKLHPILRTAFVSHQQQVYQVMRNSFQPSFEKAYCITSQLKDETKRLIRIEQNMPFQPSVPVTGFTFLDAGDQGTLIVRLSKAQFDEASASVIVQDLISSYEGTRGSSGASSFYQYMRGARHSYGNVLGYWAVQMKDAVMTEVVTHSKPCRPTSRVKVLRQTAKISSFINHGITPDTMIKAAWAMVLATISGRDDVLFGEVVHGHNVALPDNADLTTMVGPLTNTIPVRVRFPAVHSAPIDLMKCIQRQRQSNYRFEAMGIDEMRRHVCAEWPSWARYSTVVHHRSSAHTDGSATYNMGGTTFTYKCVDPQVRDLPDVLVTSMMESAERVNIELQFPEDRVDETLAHDCLQLLMAAMGTLTHPDTLGQPMLPSADEIQRAEKRIPLVPEHSSSKQQSFKIPIDHLLLPEQRSDIEGAITEAWNEVMAISTQHLAEDRMHYTPFYSRGCPLLSAHPLAAALNRNLSKLSLKDIDTIVFTPEDVVDNPTMAAQLDLVAKRLREGGSLSLPLPAPPVSKKSSSNNSNNLLKPDSSPRSKNDNNNNTAATLRRRKSASGNAEPTSLKWRNSILRGRDSLRSLSIRPPAWKKSKDPARPVSPLPPTVMEESRPVPQGISALVVPSLPHIHIHMSEVAELLDDESVAKLMSQKHQQPQHQQQSLSTDASSDVSSSTVVPEKPVQSTLVEEKMLAADEYLVSPLSPTPSDARLSMWGALYESARTLTPLGFQIASK